MISAPSIAHHTSVAVTTSLDTLVDDAIATAPAAIDPSILRRSTARLSYIKGKLGVSAPLLNLTRQEIAAEVQIVTARSSTDDSIVDEEIAGVQVEAEVLAAFDSPDHLTTRESDATALLNPAEHRQLAAEVAALRRKRVALGLSPI